MSFIGAERNTFLNHNILIRISVTGHKYFRFLYTPFRNQDHDQEINTNVCPSDDINLYLYINSVFFVNCES